MPTDTTDRPTDGGAQEAAAGVLRLLQGASWRPWTFRGRVPAAGVTSSTAFADEAEGCRRQ